MPQPAVESDGESGSKGSSVRYTDRPDARQKRTGNSDGAIQLLLLALMAVETRARATSERKRHGAAMVLEPLREEAQMAVEAGMGVTSSTMVLEPLRKEVLTDVDSELRTTTLSSYDESEMNPTACGTTTERPYRQCQVIGTWDNVRDLREITWEGGAYRCCVMPGESAEESFQIVVDGLRTRQRRPAHTWPTSCADRTMVAAVKIS